MPISFSSNSQHYSPSYSPEVIQQLEEYFVSNPHLSAAEIARRSKKLFGTEISVETVKDLSQAGGWRIKRSAVNANSASEVAGEVHDIRRIVYEQIINSGREGVFIEGLSLAEVQAAINDRYAGRTDIIVYELKGGSVDPQMVNAYMNLLAKSKIEVNVSSSSGKTSRQEVIEIAGAIIQGASFDTGEESE